jgi:hypothetical protein
MLAAGCGGGSAGSRDTATSGRTRHVAAAVHVCGSAQRAAEAQLGGSSRVHIGDSHPTNIECVVHGKRARLDIVAQATSVAWTEYDTATVHQVQAFGSGSVHQPSQIPRNVYGVGGLAAWIPAQNELVATNGTQSRGGCYLTVKVTHSSLPARTKVQLARTVAKATLAIAPRGPNPGAPPS